MSDWIRNPDIAASPVWNSIALPEGRVNDGLGLNDGIGVVEWLNLATGAALLLDADGSRSAGGEVRLYWLAPGASEAKDVSALLGGKEGRRYPANGKDEADAAKGRAQRLVDQHLQLTAR